MEDIKLMEEIQTFENNSIEEIQSKLEKLEDQLVSYNDGIQKAIENLNLFYTGFSAKTDNLVKNLDKEVVYTRNLESQIAQKRSEYEALELKKALEEERAMFLLSIEKMGRDVSGGMSNLDSWQKDTSRKIIDVLNEFDNKIDELSKVENTITERIEIFRKDMTKASTQEYNILKGNCEKFLVDSCSALDEIKKDVILFLKECKKQNEELIKKIPLQKNKVNVKDILVFTLSGTCILQMIVQVLCLII